MEETGKIAERKDKTERQDGDSEGIDRRDRREMYREREK